MIERPIIILGAPRSGTTLLFELLSGSDGLWSIGSESGAIIERDFHPRRKDWESGVLTAADLTPSAASSIRRELELRAAPGGFWRRFRRVRRKARRLVERAPGRSRADAQPRQVDTFALRIARRSPFLLQEMVRAWHRVHPIGHPIRVVEKTPENCLRVPFLEALFPDASFIHLTRSGPANVASLMAGWRHPFLFEGHRVPAAVRIPGDTRNRWAFALVPGWRDLLDRPLEEVCAQQWIRCNAAVLEAAASTSAPWLTVRFEDLVSDPVAQLDRISHFVDVELCAEQWTGRALPVVNALSMPDPERWRTEPTVRRILPMIEPMMERLGYDMPPGGASSGGTSER